MSKAPFQKHSTTYKSKNKNKKTYTYTFVHTCINSHEENYIQGKGGNYASWGKYGKESNIIPLQLLLGPLGQSPKYLSPSLTVFQAFLFRCFTLNPIYVELRSLVSYF